MRKRVRVKWPGQQTQALLGDNTANAPCKAVMLTNMGALKSKLNLDYSFTEPSLGPDNSHRVVPSTSYIGKHLHTVTSTSADVTRESYVQQSAQAEVNNEILR